MTGRQAGDRAPDARPVQIVLASSSPRRIDLFRTLGLPFRVESPDVDETPEAGEAPERLVRRLACAKAERIAAAHPEAIVVAADTVIVLDGEPLGKPSDADEALVILRKLRGREHEVLTGVCILGVREGIRRVDLARSVVRMADLQEADLRAYARSGEPIGKAGAYAIQGGAARFLELVRGSRTNVIGLPLELVGRLLSGRPPRPAEPDGGD